MLSRFYQHRILLIGACIALAGLLAGRWGYTHERQVRLAALMRVAERGAAAFDAAELNRLSGTKADLDTETYAEVKARMIRFRGADPLVRFVYIFRKAADSDRVTFLGDSEKPESAQISLPGDDYSELEASPGLQAILSNGRPATEGPGEDEFGSWVTGYALISRDAAGHPREVLGIDIAASDWRAKLWEAGLRSASYVWLLLGLPLIGYVLLRRHHEQREVIRNLSEAIEQSHTAVMIIDLRGSIEYANRGFAEQVGFNRRELLGHSWREFARDTMPALTAAEMTSATQARRNWSAEWQNRRKDGTAYPVRGIVTAVRNRQNLVSCYVAVYEDLSEIRRNERVLREAKEQAEAGGRAKSQFLATMSHEVRTPLNGIVGFTNLLLETPLTAEQREYMQTIRASGDSLIQLTNDILDFARIESGKMKLELQPCDVRECIEDSLDLMATRASEKRIELLHWVDETVPAYLLTDAGRLRQVLLNLVNNAVKFTVAGEVAVTLSARLLEPARSGRAALWELKFAVRDTGIGIEATQYGKLFRPFSQLEETNTRRYGGTGLGLAICSNLVGLMGGEISVESEPKVGSTFTFTIRAREAAEVDGPPRLPPPNIAGLRIAVATPSASLRQEISRLGERWNARVTAMTSEELPAQGWDVAVVDLSEAAAAELGQSAEARRNLPCEKMVALVPLGLSPAVRLGLRPHFRLLINKPASHESLRAALASPITSTATPIPFAPVATFDLRVLLVEDNPVNQRLMQKVLTRLGCRWAVAENGRIALQELQRAEYHVVLMDLHMPEMDGLTAISEIRRGQAGEAMKSVWIAALTADARADQRDRVMAIGANDYLVKPVRLQDLEKMLHRFIEQRAARSGA